MNDLTVAELHSLIHEHAEQIRRSYAHTVEAADNLIDRAERIAQFGRVLQGRLPKQADLPPPMVAIGDER